MWTLVLLWVVGTSVTTQAIPGFESQQACEAAVAGLQTEVKLQAEVNQAPRVKLVGKCVSLKEETAKK